MSLAQIFYHVFNTLKLVFCVKSFELCFPCIVYSEFDVFKDQGLKAIF